MNSLKSTAKPPPRSRLNTFTPTLISPTSMHQLREFYRKYRQYILSDGLMYVVFILVLVLMFMFFG